MLQTQTMCWPSSHHWTQQRWLLQGKFRNLNFSPFTKKTTECYFNELFLSMLWMLDIFPQVYNFNTVEQLFCYAGCPKAPHDFLPRKDDILLPLSGCLGTPFILPQSLYGWRDVCTFADITTQFSCTDSLANLFTNGALLKQPLAAKALLWKAFWRGNFFCNSQCSLHFILNTSWGWNCTCNLPSSQPVLQIWKKLHSKLKVK